MDVPRTRLFTLAGWFICAVLAGGCGQIGVRSHEEEVSEGGRLYTQYCALCHGDEGQGYQADNATRLRGEAFLRTASDELLEIAIALGRGDSAMAAYGRESGGPLDDEQVDAIVAYIRTWQTGDPIPVADVHVEGDALVGETIYGERCAGCHGMLGQGATAQSLASTTFMQTASDGFLRYAVVHGRSETPMPAFENDLTDAQIDGVVAFLRRWDVEPRYVPQSVRGSLEEVTIIRYPEGPTPHFTLRDERFVPAAQVRDAVAARSRLIIIDARPPSAWLRRRLPGAITVPYYDIEPAISRLPRDGTWIVAYCGCPHAESGTVVDRLREAGFRHTAVLDEGVNYWAEQHYPIESGPVERDPAPPP